MTLERLLAQHRRDTPHIPLDILLIDPHEPGGGRIWRRDQSPLLKLNTLLSDAAVFPDKSCELHGPIEPGPSLAEWIRDVRAGLIARQTGGTISLNMKYQQRMISPSQLGG